MIIRVFRAQIHPGNEAEFERFVRETGVPTVEAQAGCSHVAWGSKPLERPARVRRRDALGLRCRA
jgi:quinol monooxygenase YgiN